METMNATINNIDKAFILANSHHGVYMVKIFLENWRNDSRFNLHESFNEDVETVLNSDPYSEGYFDSVDAILDAVTLTIDGETYDVVFNEDLWAIPQSMTDEEWDEFMI